MIRRSLARRTECLVMVSVCLTCLTGSSAHAVDDPAKEQFSQAALIRFEGEITPRLEHYLYRKLDEVRDQGADLVIVEIDSPGGLLEPSLGIATHLRDLDWAHTVAYIPREGLSGAAIVALGCDEIIMNPHAVMGDAGPIVLGEHFLFEHAPEKVRTDLAEKLRGLATAKGRPPALAEAMVDMNLVVHRVKNRETGQIDFKSDAEIESSDQPDDWEKIQPVLESREDHFLEVSGSRAVELNLSDGTEESREALATRYGLKEQLIVIEPSGVDTAVYVLNHPFITGFLVVAGLIALYVEFSAPGISIGGLLAGLCFSLFFWSRFLGGTADWLEVVLFVAGVAFLLVELFVFPGFGVAGLTGILLMFASVILASHTFIIPNTTTELAAFGNTLLVVLISMSVVTVAVIMLTWMFGEVPVLGRLALRQPSVQSAVEDTHTELPPVASQQHASDLLAISVGDEGIADSPLRPAGIARFDNQFIDVVTEGTFVEAGERVRVLSISGNRVVVRDIG